MRAALAGVAAMTIASSAAAQDTRTTARLPAPASRSVPDAPRVRYSEFTLKNGLRVLVHEDHSSPIVALELWYNVGSKHDPRGKTGLAHMFEHMMDEGTLNMPLGEFRRTVQTAGGSYGAYTSNDWSRYTMTMPSTHLETALWLEAERMANLSPTLDSARFRVEREAVRNEYRDRIMNVAPLSGAEVVFQAIFPEGAYASPLFGHQSELDNATVEDLRRFYETYYVPNNAVLVIAGDLTVADARRKVEKHFGAIPRGKPVVHPKAVGPLTGEKRLVVEHPAGLRQVWTVWRGAKSGAPDRPAAMAMAAILTERVRRLMLDERRLSTLMNPAHNQHYDLQEAGILQIVITLAPTASATTVETLVDSIAASIRRDGVTETELRRWVASYRMQMLSSMQSVQMKADYLADATLNTGDPMNIFGVVEKAQRLTTGDVLAAARKYLTTDRIVLSIVPPGKLDQISKPELPYVNATRKGS